MSQNHIAETKSCPPVKGPGVDEIQVWWVPLELAPEVVESLDGWLSPEERERGSRFHFRHDQRRFIVRRGVLRSLLANALAVNPRIIRMETGRNGKPVVDGLIKFNCSHSGDWALIAMSRNLELGVDLEQQRDMPDAGELANAFFSDRENRELMALPPERRRTAFFTCWTRKEAFLKAVGLGLSFPLNRFSVSLAPDQPAALLEADDELGAKTNWTFACLDTRPGFSAALVHESRSVNVSVHQWSPALLGNAR